MVYGEYIQKSSVDLCEVSKFFTQKPWSNFFDQLRNWGHWGSNETSQKIYKEIKIYCCKKFLSGSTQGALSLLGVKNQKKGYGPLLPKVSFIDFNNNKQLVKIDKNTAAVILETIQGGAGFIVPKLDYLKNVKEKCQEVGALLILDEIQPGIGRTGKMFAFQKYRVEPDILVVGKGLGGGLPIGAFCSSKRKNEKFENKPSLDILLLLVEIQLFLQQRCLF